MDGESLKIRAVMGIPCSLSGPMRSERYVHNKHGPDSSCSLLHPLDRRKARRSRRARIHKARPRTGHHLTPL